MGTLARRCGPFVMAAAVAFDVVVRWRGDVVRLERRRVPSKSPLSATALGLSDLEIDAGSLRAPSIGEEPVFAQFGDVSVEIVRAAS